MPFKCCMRNNLQNNLNEEHEDFKFTKKIPKPIDLNEGYNSQLELLIFNNRQNNNQIYQEYNSINKRVSRLKYDPIQYFSTSPVTFVETKVSNLVNTPSGPAIAEASSNLIFSGCNSPIKLFASVEATPKAKCLNYIEPSVLTASMSNIQIESNSSITEKKKLEDKNYQEKKIHEINNYSPAYKGSDQEIDYFGEEPKLQLFAKSDQTQNDFELENRSKEVEDYLMENGDEFKCENGQIQKYTNTSILSDEAKFDIIKMNDKNEKVSSINVSDIKDDINELIILKKLKNENNYTEKKKKKSKKTIHIEISFSPKNNIFFDAKYNQNENKNQLEPNNKIELYNSNGKIPTEGVISFESGNKKNIFIDSNGIDSNGFYESSFKDIHKANNHEPIINELFETYEPECKKLIKEPVINNENNPQKKEISNLCKNVSSSCPLNDVIEDIQNTALLNYDSSFEEHSKIDIKSFEKLIPFIDESETKTDYLTNIEKGVKSNYSAQKELINSLTEIKQSDNKAVELSRETLEKLNGSLPVVESDPQMAQLFASAQIRIEDINNQNGSFEDNKCLEECDPIDSIVKFLSDPSKYKDSISWASIKAIKEVYEPQVEYAKKELERWVNTENKSDESKDNVDYYSNLIFELQEKVILAEKAKELLLTQYKSDNIQFMLQNEKKNLEEIKKKISKESNELKLLEEQYLNGCINLKEEVRTSRIKIKNLENELKSKLAEIHKLDELLMIQEN